MKLGLSIILCAVVVLFVGIVTRGIMTCPVPLEYRLGSLDESFGLSTEAAIGHITAAEIAWETTFNRELFTYADDASFTIDFVYDERQEFSDAESSDRTKLDAEQMANEVLRQQITTLQVEYDALRDAYEDDRSNYESELSAYNRKVQRYNDQGGAPPDAFDELNDEQAALEASLQALTARSAELNTLAENINQLSAEGNKRIAQYNTHVSTYNEKFGYEREFTQGDYQGDSIAIYEFSDEEELQRVLAHEFGHALGIDHVDDEAALMYYLLQDSATALSFTAVDETAFRAVCGAHSNWYQRIRGWWQQWS